MFRIEKIGSNHFYIKVLGTFPPSVTENFLKEFGKQIENFDRISVIVDGADFILLNLKSFEDILNFLKKNNEKLEKSAWIITTNILLDKEIQILLKKAESPKRKIVRNLEEAKRWIGIEKIMIEKH
ncbi:hypothetical protein LCGC14_0642520 [marine sediment metagenome]|uniref:STAS/SEC14 domain-containing protein n=1 Tax=marine sediment metagenome TaxID=412755 RepID=A0A0F9QYS6_9ZZZZ